MTDSRAKSFGSTSVELDAMEPGRLRRIVESAIERLMPRHQLDTLKAAEESERLLLHDLVKNIARRS
jgi:hypothetical protein